MLLVPDGERMSVLQCKVETLIVVVSILMVVPCVTSLDCMLSAGSLNSMGPVNPKFDMSS